MANDVTLPGTGQLVETEQQQDGSHRQVMSLGLFLDKLLAILTNGMDKDPSTGAQRATLVAGAANIGAIAIQAAQTLATVTTVGTVTTMSQMAAIPLNSFVFDAMYNAYANGVRRCIS